MDLLTRQPLLAATDHPAANVEKRFRQAIEVAIQNPDAARALHDEEAPGAVSCVRDTDRR